MARTDPQTVRILPCGDDAILAEYATLDEVREAAAALTDAPPSGVVEIVPAARTIMLVLRRDTDPAVVAAAVRTLRPGSAAATGTDRIEIPVVYDGADLDEVAAHTGLSVAEVIETHTTSTWTVAFCGFVPGFGYLVTDHARLHVPRRSSPRTTVPAGAIGLAGEFSGAYPRASPGGWQLIGHTDLTLWDQDRDPPALLRPGIEVRFVPMDPP